MKNSKFRLFKWGSAVLVVAAAICLFLSKEATDTQMVSSPTTQHATISLDPRPEIRVEQLLHLDYFGFDPSLASLLKEQKERPGTMDQSFSGNYEQIASTRTPRKGGGDR